MYDDRELRVYPREHQAYHLGAIDADRAISMTRKTIMFSK